MSVGRYQYGVAIIIDGLDRSVIPVRNAYHVLLVPVSWYLTIKEAPDWRYLLRSLFDGDVTGS